MNFFILTVLFTLGACSYKSPDKDSKSVSRSQEEVKPEEQTDPTVLAKMDSDGDRINDLAEKEAGLNPFVANIPEIRARFIQDFEIFLRIHPPGKPDNGWVTAISTKVGRRDPNFQYRVGEIYVREKAFEESAKVGKFTTHIMGEIKAIDLTWIKYPEIGPKFMGPEIMSLDAEFPIWVPGYFLKGDRPERLLAS